MPTNQFGVTEFDADPTTAAELIRLKKQQAIADAMMGKAQTPIQGQMVGGVYVAPSITQGLAQMFNAYQGRKTSQGVEEGYKTLAGNKSQMMSDEVSRIAKLKVGTPEQPMGPPTEEGDMGVQPAVAPANSQRITAALLESKLPEFKKAGLAQLLQEGKQVEKFGHDVKFTKDGKPYVAGDLGTIKYLDPNVTPRDKAEFVNGQAVNPYTAATGATPTVIPKQSNPYSDLVIPGADGTVVPNQPLITAKQSIAKAGASKNTVNVAGSENEYNKDVGKGMAKDSLTAVELAQQAPEVIRNAESIRSALKAGAITGTAAEIRQSIEKALATAGVVGEGKAASTQELVAGLSKVALSGIKTSGLGTGQGFTDKDLRFLSDAISGSIDSTPTNILRVADLSERVARQSHDKGSKILTRWKGDPSLKTISQDMNIPEIGKSITRKVQLKDGRIGVEYSDGTRGYE